MLQSLRSLMSRPSAADSGLGWLDPWSQRRGEKLKRVRGDVGFVIEARFSERPLRVEWGPSQRDYLLGRELRLRYDLGLPAGLEMLIVSRDLAEQLEARTFDDLTRDQQTGIETDMPEEARWLAMYDRVHGDLLPAGLRDLFVVLGAREGAAQAWVDGDLGLRLTRAAARWLGRETPLVLMTLRGRVYLRTEANALDESLLDAVRQLGDAAAAAALRAAERPVAEPSTTTLDIDEVL
jgi:hypothetical protein